MALSNITYDIREQTKELGLLNSLYYFERFMVVVNTRGVSVTPTLTLENTDVTLSTFSSSVRDYIEVTVNRIGPFSQFSLSPVVDMQWYSVECVIRPLVLGLQLVAGQPRTNFPGRTSSIGTTIRWDINAFALPQDARNQSIIIRRIFFDLVTGAQSVTPVLEFNDGTTQSLAAITQATRSVVEYNVTTAKRLNAVRLDGDFTSSDIVIYDAELDCYNPNARQLAVG